MFLLAGPVSDCEVPRMTKQNYYGTTFPRRVEKCIKLLNGRTCQRFCPSSSSLLFSPDPAAPGSRFSRTGAIFSFSFYNQARPCFLATTSTAFIQVAKGALHSRTITSRRKRIQISAESTSCIEARSHSART